MPYRDRFIPSKGDGGTENELVKLLVQGPSWWKKRPSLLAIHMDRRDAGVEFVASVEPVWQVSCK